MMLMFDQQSLWLSWYFCAASGSYQPRIFTPTVFDGILCLKNPLNLTIGLQNSGLTLGAPSKDVGAREKQPIPQNDRSFF